MRLTNEEDPNTSQLDLEFELYARYKNFSISVPFNDFGSTVVAETLVDWWNVVSVNRMLLQRNIPQVRLKYHITGFQLSCTIIPYKLIVEEYRGVDVVGNSNYVERISKFTNSKGIGFNFEIKYSLLPDPFEFLSISEALPEIFVSLFFDHFNKYNHLGFKIGYGLDFVF